MIADERHNNLNLLPISKVFFVHYQRDDFNEGEQITVLGIHSKGRAKDYKGNEIESIKDYASRVNELLTEGLTLVHWNQDRPNYGTDHINNRYKDLTGENLGLEYSNEINLAEWLIFNYGQNYISHPRLDNLAKLNEFYGIRETELGQKTFATNRLLLLNKVYFNAFNGSLKTELSEPQLVQKTPSQKEIKTLSELITHQKNIEIVEQIKIQYKNIKGKGLKLLLMAFQDLDLIPKERMDSKFHKACKNEFDWDIASYNAMNNYSYNHCTDKEDLDQKKSYLESIIKSK